MTKRDEKALKSLEDITCTRTNDEEGFELRFFFKANSYFSNPILTKTFLLVNEDELYTRVQIVYGEQFFRDIRGTNVIWDHGKKLTRSVLEENKRLWGSKKSKAIHRKAESFF